MTNLVDVASKVVVPAIRAVFKDGEVTAFALSVTNYLEGTVALSITAQGETFDYPVIQGDVPDMGPEEWSENLRSLLVDFVAIALELNERPRQTLGFKTPSQALAEMLR